MNEEVIINTERLSNEEKRVLESTFAFECSTGYNLIGAKQYKLPKDQLVNEIKKGLALHDKQEFEAAKNSMLRTIISGLVIVFSAGIIATLVSNPFSVMYPAAIVSLASAVINKKITDKKNMKLSIAKKARKTLLTKIEEASLKEAVKKAQAKIELKEQEKNKEQEKGNISLEVNASSEVIEKTGNKIQNISNTEVSVKIETTAKEAEPKKMVKERNK